MNFLRSHHVHRGPAAAALRQASCYAHTVKSQDLQTRSGHTTSTRALQVRHMTRPHVCTTRFTQAVRANHSQELLRVRCIVCTKNSSQGLYANHKRPGRCDSDRPPPRKTRISYTWRRCRRALSPFRQRMPRSAARQRAANEFRWPRACLSHTRHNTTPYHTPCHLQLLHHDQAGKSSAAAEWSYSDEGGSRTRPSAMPPAASTPTATVDPTTRPATTRRLPALTAKSLLSVLGVELLRRAKAPARHAVKRQRHVCEPVGLTIALTTRLEVVDAHTCGPV